MKHEDAKPVETTALGFDPTAICDHKIVTMSQKPRKPRAGRKRPAGGHGPVGVAVFKARCLEFTDRVRETGVEYVITKHGVPVAKLVPYTSGRTTSLFGSMQGTVLHYERPLDPLDDDYDVNRS